MAASGFDRREVGRRATVEADEPRLSLEPDHDFQTGPDDEVFIQVNADLADLQEDRLQLATVDPTLATPATPPAAHLPLFAKPAGEDEPLVKLPAAPRAPLAVRRSLDTPRLRAVPRAPRVPAEPALQFSDEPAVAAAVTAQAPLRPPAVRTPGPVPDGAVSRVGARLLAALVDYAILFGIDLGVIYFTVRMAGLSMGEWRLLPLAPMLAFLGLLKVSYFYAFTAVGGQTIGKMAAGTCVIADDGGAVDATRALRRTCVGLLSALLLGLGYVPALFGRRLALHDRVAGTRVVSLRPV